MGSGDPDPIRRPAPSRRFRRHWPSWGASDWRSYWKTRSRNARDRVGRRSRRFADKAKILGLVEDQAEFGERLLTWTLAYKSDWMARTGLDNDFLRTAEFPVFLREIGATPHGE